MMMHNIIVGQSGGPTAVINASLVGVYKAAKELGVKILYGMKNGIQGFLAGNVINFYDHIHDELDVELLKRTPSAYLGSCRYKLPEIDENEAIYQTIFSKLIELDISAFFYIGGNDSMDTINKLSVYAKNKNIDIKFIGIPKTIDNDLAITDHTPGFGSAAKCVGTLLKEIIIDGHVYDTHNITVVEIMGRNAGWLTASSCLSKMEDCQGPDMILLPEVNIDIDNIMQKVAKIQDKQKNVVIAVSEGLKLKDGRYVCELDNNAEFVDAFGHKALSGTARVLANNLAYELGCKTRAIELSTIQRCASHIVSRTDITEAFQVGGSAVKTAYEGQTGKMIVINRVSNDPYISTFSPHDVGKICNIEKKVPLNWLNHDHTYVTKEFLTYCRPLIQAELTPVMVDGLPRHLADI